MAAAEGRAATRVAAGILVTRILGFVRERVFAHYFGNGELADAFRAAYRIPNAIRNLLGEGTLSASFIPVYAGLIERGETEAARRVAGTIASLLV
ncbi:MAG TPA: lipid II flippase MurJ, partial [Gemmatimonadales bacterium]